MSAKEWFQGSLDSSYNSNQYAPSPRTRSSLPYVAPSTIDEACDFLRSNPGSRVFAGATDILPQSKAGRRLPEFLVDLKRIPRLTGLNVDDKLWRIGASTPAAHLTRDSRLSGEFPGLVEAAGLIGSDQIQTRASLGGNLCNASPAADTGPSLVVNEFSAVIASPEGERTVPVTAITTGPGQTSLTNDEFIVEFLADRPAAGTSDAYQRFTPRTEMDIAVVGAGARVSVGPTGEVTNADLVLGAVAPTTVPIVGISDALVGRSLDEPGLERAADLAKEQIEPISDKRGTRDFRIHIAGVLTKRVLRTAAERAGAES